MNKSTFDSRVKDIDGTRKYIHVVNGPSIDELQRRYLSGNCLFRQYFKKWYQICLLYTSPSPRD